LRLFSFGGYGLALAALALMTATPHVMVFNQSVPQKELFSKDIDRSVERYVRQGA